MDKEQDAESMAPTDAVNVVSVLVAQGTGWSVHRSEYGWPVWIDGSDLLVQNINDFVDVWDQDRSVARSRILAQAYLDEHKARINECFDADWSGSAQIS